MPVVLRRSGINRLKAKATLKRPPPPPNLNSMSKTFSAFIADKVPLHNQGCWKDDPNNPDLPLVAPIPAYSPENCVAACKGMGATYTAASLQMNTTQVGLCCDRKYNNTIFHFQQVSQICLSNAFNPFKVFTDHGHWCNIVEKTQ